MSANISFFRREGDRYLPTEAAHGFWAPDSINGRMVVGLLGFELERLYGQPGWQPTRLTVDMYRLPRHAPVEVRTRLLRDGGRLRLAEADYICDGVPIGRASIQFLKRSQSPPDRLWSPSNWDAPPPHLVPPDSRESSHWERRPILGQFGSAAPARAWFRETRELVGGFPHTPFTRVAAAADVASPMSNSSPDGIGYINSDVTLYLSRLPATEWLGMEAVNHQSSEGVAIGECWIHDEAGPIGSATIAAIPQQRRVAANAQTPSIRC